MTKLWNDSVLDASRVVYIAKDVLWDWLRAKQKDSYQSVSNIQGEIVPWNAPSVGFVKCNVDAACFSAEKIVSFGICLRNENGRVLACRTKWRKAAVSIKEGEAMGLYESLTWVTPMGMGYTNVIFEMDAKGVVEAVNRGAADVTEFGTVVDSCKEDLKS
ncbi:hypothetical protein DITRI_Ditri12bG0041700 [Diplodiscus trichospermus]